jgi:hypothetical protein
VKEKRQIGEILRLLESVEVDIVKPEFNRFLFRGNRSDHGFSG